VPFSSGDKALIRNLYRFKKYSFRRIMAKFKKKKLQWENSRNVINRDLENNAAPTKGMRPAD